MTPGLPSTQDRETPVEELSQSQRIFENVCDQLNQPFGSGAPDMHRVLFVASLADGAETHLDRIDASTLTDVYRELWSQMAAYLDRHSTSLSFEKKKDRVTKMYRRFTERVSALVADGQVEPRTAKVFLRMLPSLKHVGPYAAVVRNHEDVPPEYFKAKSERYAGVVKAMWARQPEEARHQSGGFCHFNSHLGTRLKNRIYISARLSAAPERVIEAWQAALLETGFEHDVYFKVPAELSRRFETIILYQSDRMYETEIEALLTAFVRRCPQDLLSKRDMPTGVPLRRGVSIAPEPADINTVNRYAGSPDRISYNQLIAWISQLSLELAYKDADLNGVPDPTLQGLKASAGGYFDQMLKLSEINPQTMVPESQGGKLPAWAEKISTASFDNIGVP